jgi:hypothetical protein
MNFQSFNIDKINYKGKKLLYDGDNIVRLKTPEMCCRFGLESNYGKQYIKLEFIKSENDLNTIRFLNVIKSIENKNIKQLGITHDLYQSALKFSDTYEPLLATRIQSIRDKVIIDVQVDNNTDYLSTIYDIKKKSNMKCEIEFANMWESQRNSYGCIVYIRKIILT